MHPSSIIYKKILLSPNFLTVLFINTLTLFFVIVEQTINFPECFNILQNGTIMNQAFKIETKLDEFLEFQSSEFIFLSL